MASEELAGEIRARRDRRLEELRALDARINDAYLKGQLLQATRLLADIDSLLKNMDGTSPTRPTFLTAAEAALSDADQMIRQVEALVSKYGDDVKSAG